MADGLTYAPDGEDSFIQGSNSFVSPWKLGPGAYVISSNTINRGGILQTRPGARSRVLTFVDAEQVEHINQDIPGANVQGITIFKPSSGPANLVFVVDGVVYASPYPFKKYHRLDGLQFSPYSKYVAFASCVQSTEYNPEGILVVLDKPRAILVMQDGVTRAGIWDGGTAYHINPTVSDSETTQTDRDGTPVGLWMKWSNNRLWVSRDDQVFASDIGNPLKFTETQYLNEARAFYLPGKCTGMVETSDQQGVICFTAEVGVLIQTSIQDRTLWLQTPDLQKTILPSIGCTAPRSIVQQYGLIWWMTEKGLISMDDASRLNVSSRLNIEDQEMAKSKAVVYRDISMVCGSFFENYLFHAVPYAHKVNTRIHVLDQAPMEESYVNSWPSYWDGWFQPVEFTRGIIANQERVFAISKDTDGVNRIWEFFKDERTDNGVPITSHVETRVHNWGNRDYKEFGYAEVEAVGLSGDVSMLIAAGGIKGAFQTIGTKEIVATHGQVYADVEYDNDTLLNGSRVQIRIVKTTEGADPSDCNDGCMESKKRGLIDKGFSLYITWSGIAGISAYRVFAKSHSEAYSGECEDNEDGIKVLTPQGCLHEPTSEDDISTATPFVTYEGEETYIYLGQSDIGEATSKISQADADRKAEATAKFFVLSQAGVLV